jgi:hypothetical protein
MALNLTFRVSRDNFGRTEKRVRNRGEKAMRPKTRIFSKTQKASEQTLQLFGFLAALAIASVSTWTAETYAAAPSVGAILAGHAYSQSRTDTEQALNSAVDPATADSDEPTSITLNGDSKLSVVMLDGLREAEDKADKLLGEFARLPGGTIKVTHIGPNVPAELQIFLRLLRALNKDREAKQVAGTSDLEPFTIDFEFVKTQDADLYLKSTSPEEMEQRLVEDLKKSGWALKYHDEVAREVGERQADKVMWGRIKEASKNAWSSASAWINHAFGVTKKGVSWINYKAKRSKEQLRADAASVITRLSLVSVFLVYALHSKNDAGANLNIWLPVIANILLTFGFDINPKGNREHKAQGKNWNPEMKTFEDNKKCFLLVGFLHTLLFRQVFEWSMHMPTLAGMWLGVKASITGQFARVPVDLTFRNQEKKINTAWEKSLRDAGIPQKVIETKEPPTNWRYLGYTAVWGLVIAAMQVNKQLLTVATGSDSAFIYQWIDQAFSWLGYSGGALMLWINRKSVWSAVQRTADRITGSKRNCLTLLTVDTPSS